MVKGWSNNKREEQWQRGGAMAKERSNVKGRSNRKAEEQWKRDKSNGKRGDTPK